MVLFAVLKLAQDAGKGEEIPTDGRFPIAVFEFVLDE
jgi:hypothetical protein